MPRWADYLISAVRYDETVSPKLVAEVQIHRDGYKIPPADIWSRQQLLKALCSIRTITWDEKKGWQKGPTVKRVKVNGIFYLKIERNELEGDDLGDIPSF